MNKKSIAVGPLGSDGLTRKKERNVSLDIIRIIAFSMVVYTHFFMYTGFYKMEIVGTQAFWMSVVRCNGISCIPMFLFLTGYLMKERTLSGKYYKGLRNTLVTYMLASAACYIFDCNYAQEEMSFTGYLKGLLGFTSADYSWYIEMYIGLFLMIPFLNIIWKNLTEKKHRIILIASLFFLTVAPQVVNTFAIGVEGWWQQPSMSEEYFLIIPEWWVRLLPFTCYFTGCYIREYGVKINRWLNLILIFATSIGFGAYSYYRSTPGIFLRGNWQNNASPFVFLLAFLIFVFIINLNLKVTSTAVKKISSTVAELSLGAYLVSCIFDQIVYDRLNEITQNAVPFSYLWFVAPLIISLSLLTAFVINLITKLILKIDSGIELLISKLIPGKKKAEAAEMPEKPERPQRAEGRERPKAAPPARAPRQAAARPAAPAQRAPAAPSQDVYKKRINTYEDDAEEVIVVIEDKEYSAPVYR